MNIASLFKSRITRSNLTSSPDNNIDVLLDDYFYTFSSSGSAILSVVYHSLDRLSDEAGKTTCAVTFSTDIVIAGWEARATYESQTPGPGVGWVVGNGGAVNAGGTASFDVTFDELTYGDRVYTISVYQLS